EEFLEVCQRAGVAHIATVTGDLDVGNDDGLFQARILTAVAAKESADKARRLRRKHLEMARSGRSAWGVGGPFGYTYDSGTKAPRPALNRQGKGQSMLSGLLHCSCGAPMWRSSSHTPRRSTYECSRARKKRQGECRAGGLAALRVESLIAEQFLARISAPYAE